MTTRSVEQGDLWSDVVAVGTIPMYGPNSKGRGGFASYIVVSMVCHLTSSSQSAGLT